MTDNVISLLLKFNNSMERLELKKVAIAKFERIENCFKNSLGDLDEQLQSVQIPLLKLLSKLSGIQLQILQTRKEVIALKKQLAKIELEKLLEELAKLEKHYYAIGYKLNPQYLVLRELNRHKKL